LPQRTEGGGCHDDALERELLEDGHGDVAGSRRHVDEQVVELGPFERIGCACSRVRIRSALGYVSTADFEKADWPEEEKSRPMAE
jgi:hypothetical protein